MALAKKMKIEESPQMKQITRQSDKMNISSCRLSVETNQQTTWLMGIRSSGKKKAEEWREHRP